MYVCVCIYLFIYSFIYLFIHLFIYLFIYLLCCLENVYVCANQLMQLDESVMSGCQVSHSHHRIHGRISVAPKVLVSSISSIRNRDRNQNLRVHKLRSFAVPDRKNLNFPSWAMEGVMVFV